MPKHDDVRDIIVSIANSELLPRYKKVKHSHKSDGSLITEADITVQAAIKNKLGSLYPEIVFLGEEMDSGEQARLLGSGQPLWCLDPLDGTRNFAAGIPYFSISLALLVNGEITYGCVYDPVREECFAVEKGSGASLNDVSMVLPDSKSHLSDSVAIIDFKRLDVQLASSLVTDAPYASQRSFGSVALDWCWLAAGRGHVYLHGASNIWDYAAGNLVFTEAGGYSATLDNDPIFTPRLEPRSSVGAVNNDLFNEWMGWLSGHR